MPKVRVGTLKELPEGELSIRSIGSLEVGLVRRGGVVHALRNHCPHHGAPLCRGKLGGTMLPSEPGELRYGMEDDVVRCPWHGFEFELDTGRAVCDTFKGRVEIFPTSVEGDEVWIELGERWAEEAS